MKKPIDIILHCPNCGLQHIDTPKGEWINPPHRSHLCEWCETVWRPSDECTNGVAFIQTRGTLDTWTYKLRKSSPVMDTE